MSDGTEHAANGVKLAIDTLAVGVTAATLAAWLPPLAAALSIIWTIIRIFETETVRRWLGRKGGTRK